MNILSLFDGISAGQVILDNLDVSIQNYYASEIDKNCLKVTQSNFPNTIQLGDINNWKNWDIDCQSIHLLLFGFPCQNFSIMGNKEGLKGESGKLFYIARDILNHIKKLNPNLKFLTENVPMKNEVADYISKELGVKYMEIDSANFSAQTRKRYYWFNWEYKEPNSQCKLVLGDILEKDGDFDWYEQDFDLDTEDKVVCGRLNLNGHDFLKRVNSCYHKCQTLTCLNGGSQHKKVYLNGRVRRLTNVEYERLQGFTDNYTNCNISKTSRYSLIGNSWNIPTVTYIMKKL